YSTGQLGLARKTVRRTAQRLRPHLDRGTPVVGLEPSCTAFLRNDALEVAPDDPDVKALAAATRTFAEQVQPELGQQQPPDAGAGCVRGGGHEDAGRGCTAAPAVLQAAGVRARVRGSGCCGLAGDFGIERGQYAVSVACAEQALLAAVRSAEPGTHV